MVVAYCKKKKDEKKDKINALNYSCFSREKCKKNVSTKKRAKRDNNRSDVSVLYWVICIYFKIHNQINKEQNSYSDSRS